ncbi:hypothetical protein Taro_002309 [Colocasia esculenta]|uniref:Uncharacterized protein n=1 Tax=Colocasia esculenta TaxID=4460 RepID=A0A843TIP9_COLES|nr:hypothetical protein [Colocasia esculenta]
MAMASMWTRHSSGNGKGEINQKPEFETPQEPSAGVEHGPPGRLLRGVLSIYPTGTSTSSTPSSMSKISQKLPSTRFSATAPLKLYITIIPPSSPYIFLPARQRSLFHGEVTGRRHRPSSKKQAMGHTGYAPLGRRWRRAKGFRLASARFSVLRLRLRRLAGLLGHLGRFLGSLGEGITSIRTSGLGGGSRSIRRCGKSESRRGLVCQPLDRSNSFYSEAIADCLEFIKRTSVSMDGDGRIVVTDR